MKYLRGSKKNYLEADFTFEAYRQRYDARAHLSLMKFTGKGERNVIS